MNRKKILIILVCMYVFFGKPYAGASNDNSKHLRLKHPLTYKEEAGVSRGYDSGGVLGEEIPHRNGKREGIVKRYFSDGKTLFSETPYKNGKKEGVGKEYRADGTIFRKTIHKDDRAEKDFIYYDNGQLKEENVYSRQYGLEQKKAYYEKSGKIKYEVRYGSGGRVIETKNYEDDPRFWPRGVVEYGRDDFGKWHCRKDGVYVNPAHFFGTDTLSMETPCRNYEVEGILKEYYPDGESVNRETPYRNSKREGEEKKYFQNGAVESIITYKNDQRNGLTKQYNMDGSLVSETMWQDNIPMAGKDYKNGRLDMETIYEDGYLKMKRKVYDDKGNLIRHVGFDSIEGVEIYYDKDGNEISRKKWNH
ncbi:MAG: hypothetical protein Q8L26_03415 [Candidatus Omnitrophota bacterium]|nr:hypothetical protein [Candidatus Omnitrophota bacterium]